MYQYRLFFKDCLRLSDMSKAETICLSFDIDRDILESTNSSFVVKEIPQNVNEGDLLGLIDPYGDIIYYGIVNSVEDNTINASQIESLFNDNWLYWSPSDTTIEQSIKTILETDFKGNSDPIMQAKYNFTISVETSTEGQLVSEETVQNFETMIYSFYSNFGVRLYFDIPYKSGTPTITIANREYASIKVGNNTKAIAQFTPTTEVQQLNKLIIYSSENVYRATYYMTPNGATTNASDPTRLPVINTEYIFSDDDLDVIVADKFSEEMYNHYISFQMLLENNLYDFYTLQLGTPLQIWLNQDYYDSIYTGYQITKGENENLSFAIIKCGKVRVSLTSKLLEVLS